MAVRYVNDLDSHIIHQTAPATYLHFLTRHIILHSFFRTLDLTISEDVQLSEGFIGPSKPRSADGCLVEQFPTTQVEQDARYACLRDPTNCKYGLSVSTWIKFDENDLKTDTKKVLIGTGQYSFENDCKSAYDSRRCRFLIFFKNMFYFLVRVSI